MTAIEVLIEWFALRGFKVNEKDMSILLVQNADKLNMTQTIRVYSPPAVAGDYNVHPELKDIVRVI